ncbi:RNA polymerase II C-terminal domain kinase beta subunit [Cladophialophora chaetospira]|uniref:RNA polymerase II holoenzyme cyclin-like subunit n=1 Tax=Cladophialophora chaetospira TaxID=386627 RepID=A0AA38XJN0_9EURO|nr:RNA polymerase II C-terminal domain kinase beta subunit [Cladophialophora chaetospira]
MSSQMYSDGEAAQNQTTVAHSDTDATNYGESSVSNNPSLESISSLSLPPPIDDPSPESPADDLHETDPLSPRSETSHLTSGYFSTDTTLFEFDPFTPTWDAQCECGGISPHYHTQSRLHDTMNGAQPPTGPRGEASNTAPTSPATPSSGGQAPKRPGHLLNHVQVAKSYVFEQEIQKCLRENGVSPAREDNIRLAGVQWIDNVRRALKLPVRTFNTAVVYYHKFRLQHSDGEYSFVDASAAALFAACKIEDTLKKSRDILCAAHNLKAPRNEQLSPDDQVFEHQSRTIIGLERLMLEASGFDFRNRHPQDLLIKLLKHYGFQKTDPVVKLAYSISLDLYRTWAPLKHTTVALAFACLELAGRLLGQEHDRVWTGRDYKQWKIERGMVMEPLLDLLELYTHHRSQSVIGPEFPVDRFLEVRIPLNQESEEKKIPRFSEWVDIEGQEMNGVNGYGSTANGAKSKTVSPRDVTSPRRASANAGGGASAAGAGESRAPGTPVAGVRQRVGERGREGTVRFILNPDRERDEKAVVDLFRKP